MLLNHPEKWVPLPVRGFKRPRRLQRRFQLPGFAVDCEVPQLDHLREEGDGPQMCFKNGAQMRPKGGNKSTKVGTMVIMIHLPHKGNVSEWDSTGYPCPNPAFKLGFTRAELRPAYWNICCFSPKPCIERGPTHGVCVLLISIRGIGILTPPRSFPVFSAEIGWTCEDSTTIPT